MQLTDEDKNNTPQKDLFDRNDLWLVQPIESYSSWISHQRVALSTKTVRISMWGKFMRWLSEKGFAINTCSAHHVTDFLTEFALDKEQAWRYVRLIEQTYDYLNRQGLNIRNPGRDAAQQGIGNRSNAPTRFLDPWERDDFISVLQEILTPAKSTEALDLYSKMSANEQSKIWIDLRDASIAALILGGGVKVSELGELSCHRSFVDEHTRYSTDAKIEISGKYGPRRAPLFPIAILGLEVWSQYRPLYKNLGDVLFPAMIAQRRADQLTVTAKLHPANVFRRLQALFKLAGIDGKRASGQTLRNSYIAQLIEADYDDDAIIDAMGFQAGGQFTVPRLRYDYNKALSTV